MLAALVLLWASSQSSADSSNSNVGLQEMEQYAIITDGCALVDGYHCKTPVEDDFLSRESQSNLISGNFLRAWQVAWQVLQESDDLTRDQKQIKHYKFGFTESEDAYIVLIQALLLPHIIDGQPTEVSTATLGQTTKFWIDKNSFEVRDKKYFK